MKKRFINISLACLLCLLITLVGCCCINIGDWARAEYEKTENLSAPFAPDGILNLENDVGSITVTGADVAECTLTAEITARAPSEEEAAEIGEKVKITLESDGKVLNVKIKKPSKKWRRSIRISFNITVPSRTALKLDSDVGDIDISSISSTITASTDVGSIGCEQISGDIDLKSNVGGIEVIYAGTAPAACNATVKTDVGDITFTAPEGFSAEVDASTDVGSIKTELPLTITGLIGKDLHGTIGNGEGKLTLKTDVGSITIR